MNIDLDLSLEYLDFVEQRHRVWEARQAGEPGPWTTNDIVAERKFTNVYRVLDYGSQFAADRLLSEDVLPERELLFRAFLYRHTGRPEPWEFFELVHGRFPLVEDLPHPLVGDSSPLAETWRTYRGPSRVGGRGSSATAGFYGKKDGVVTFARSVFTGAYLVFPQSQVKGTDKTDSILALAARLFHPDSPEDIMPAWEAASDYRERFLVLQRNKGVGDFMAMQTLTDWGYLTTDHENEFVVAGPGAIKGAAALAPGARPLDVIHWAHERVSELGLSVVMPSGAARSPSLMDVQNTLCEFGKYVRFMSKPLTGRPYKPAHPGPQPAPWLPPQW